MKRFPYFLLALCLLCLSGCASLSGEGADVLWYTALDNLKDAENYSVYESVEKDGEVTERTRFYDIGKAMISDPDGTIYYSLEDAKCYGIARNDDPPVWVKKEIDSSDLYFFDYEIVERLNKISGLIDQKLLKYDSKTQTFSGKDLAQTYVFRSEAHTPTELTVSLEDGMIRSIHEVYPGFRDEEKTIPCMVTEDITLSDYTMTSVRLPLDLVNYEDLDSSVFGEKD